MHSFGGNIHTIKVGHTCLDVHKIERGKELQCVETEMRSMDVKKREKLTHCDRAAIISLLLMPPIRRSEVCLL